MSIDLDEFRRTWAWIWRNPTWTREAESLNQLLEELSELRDKCAEIERLRSLLERALPWVRAELGEYEMFLARPGMVPAAYEFGKKQLAELDKLMTAIDKELKE